MDAPSPPDDRPRGGQLSRADWVAAARGLLIARGIAAVGVRGLAAALGVTPGAFYWQFRNLEDLHGELRADWTETNTAPFSRAIAGAGPDGLRQYLAWVRVLLREDEYIPDYDNAIRDWAHGSEVTAQLMRAVEATRIAQLRGVFAAMGFEGHSAEIRARVTYYHQAGYIAMRINEPLETRLRNVPFYAEILTDNRSLLSLDGPEAVRRLLDEPPTL